VAIVALKINGNPIDNNLIINGLDWLLMHNNLDGGFGDTLRARVMLSTSLLCYAASAIAE